MGMSRDVRKGHAFVELKLFEAGCGLQKIIIFLSFQTAQGPPKDNKGGTVRSVAKGLAVRHEVGVDLGPSVRGSIGPRGRAVVGGAEAGLPGHTPSPPPPSV